jgi:hypothetical protein
MLLQLVFCPRAWVWFVGCGGKQGGGRQGGGRFHSLVLLDGPGVFRASEMSLLALLVLDVINIACGVFVDLDMGAQI